MREGVARWSARALGGLLVLGIALATTTGLLKSFVAPDDEPYLRVTQVVGDHPVVTVLLLALVLTAYAVGFRWLCRLVDRWRDGATAPAGDQGPGRARVHLRLTHWHEFVDRTYSSWPRIAVTLGIVWFFFYLTSFPGQPSPDMANMMTEFLKDRSDFAVTPVGAPADETAPYEGYPTSFHLLPPGDRMWSNHHPFYLMQVYGGLAWVSIHLFDSLLPAVLLISTVSVVVTLVAFGRTLWLVGRMVPSVLHRGIALGVVIATPLIPIWSMAPHKNQWFAAGFVWLLGLVAERVHASGVIRRSWWVETALVSLLIAVSVQFGWMLLVAQAAALLLVRGHRVAAVLAVAVPGLLVWGTLAAAVATDQVIPSDPIETKGVQLQQLALTLREHPDALTPEEEATLSRIFDLDAMVTDFNPNSADPMKSSGPMVIKSSTFRYQTVTAEDWEQLDRIWLDVGRRHPDTYTDAMFLKSYRYVDPFDEETNWYPPWSYDYERTVDGHVAAPTELNLWPRTVVRGAMYGVHQVMPLRLLVAGNTKTVIALLLCAAAIATRRRYALVWATPFVLQVLIAGASPLAAGGRYVLGITYALGILVLLLAVDDRQGEQADRVDEPV